MTDGYLMSGEWAQPVCPLAGVQFSNGTWTAVMHESAHDRRRIGRIEEKVVCGRPLLREVKVVPKGMSAQW